MMDDCRGRIPDRRIETRASVLYEVSRRDRAQARTATAATRGPPVLAARWPLGVPDHRSGSRSRTGCRPPRGTASVHGRSPLRLLLLSLPDGRPDGLLGLHFLGARTSGPRAAAEAGDREAQHPGQCQHPNESWPSHRRHPMPTLGVGSISPRDRRGGRMTVWIRYLPFVPTVDPAPSRIAGSMASRMVWARYAETAATVPRDVPITPVALASGGPSIANHPDRSPSESCSLGMKQYCGDRTRLTRG